MPILDWSRTDLEVKYKDGSITSKFEFKAMTAFDLFILKRPGAEENYSEEELTTAKIFFEKLSDTQKEKLKKTVLLGLPGSGKTYSTDELKKEISEYKEIGEKELRENLSYFIKEITPVAEEAGVLLAIHPDDPPVSIMGLPRVVGNKTDFRQILNSYDSEANGLTFCSGSLGASIKNNLLEMAEIFSDRVNFIHLRNVAGDVKDVFIEENHLEGNVDMYGVIKILLVEQKRRVDEGRSNTRMPMRPDHGHLMLDDQHLRNFYPGYSLYGRMKGLAELRGMEMAILRSL